MRVCVGFVHLVHEGNKLYLMRRREQQKEERKDQNNRLTRMWQGGCGRGEVAGSFIGRVMNSRRIKLLIANVCCSGSSVLLMRLGCF